ncbi:MAG: HD domain-containing phosphohydrolase [Thermoleophilia bacterium]
MAGPERVAEIIDRLGAERRPERLAAAALDAALAVTGARAGRLWGPAAPGRRGLLAEEGRPGTGEAIVVEAPVSGPRAVVRLEVWGAAEDPGTDPVLRILAAHCALAFERVVADWERAAAQRRARRLAEAAGALHDAEEPGDAIAVALARARSLVGARAAALVAGAPPDATVTADGVDALGTPGIDALLTPERRAALAAGEWWCGALGADDPLRRHGFGAVALVGVGRGAGLGALALLDADEQPPCASDLAAVADLCGHLAGALTISGLRREVRELAVVDPLTRSFNARYFHGRVEQECQRALRAGVPLSVAIMTLDGLREMREDGRGATADAALEALGALITRRLRAMDVACRVGEDELAAILPEVEGLDALRVGERLRVGVREDPLLNECFTLSLGVASFPAQAGTGERLVSGARSALGWARADGGDRTFLFDAEVARTMRAREAEDDATEEALLATLSALAASIDARHPSTVGHSAAVARLAALLGEEMGLPPERVDELRLAGLLHDVGKIGVREDLVIREGPLSDAERDELRRHPEIGERMLSGTRLAPLRPWVLHHHERPDGRGYPGGLVASAIPLEARILAVADALDHLLHGRPGRRPIDFRRAIETIAARAGSALDAAVVAALEALAAREGEAIGHRLS